MIPNDPILSTLAWFQHAGQITGQEINERQAAFYTGMQLEELGEKLEVILGPDDHQVQMMKTLGQLFKEGRYDGAVARAIRTEPAVLLDGDLDMLWVTIGSAAAQGADVRAGYGEVGKANWAKFPNGVVTRHPVTGKVIKPEGWQEPDLHPHTYVGRANRLVAG